MEGELFFWFGQDNEPESLGWPKYCKSICNIENLDSKAQIFPSEVLGYCKLQRATWGWNQDKTLFGQLKTKWLEYAVVKKKTKLKCCKFPYNCYCHLHSILFWSSVQCNKARKLNYNNWKGKRVYSQMRNFTHDQKVCILLSNVPCAFLEFLTLTCS